MIKRTLHFGHPIRLSTAKRQLVADYPDGEQKKVPIEDVGVVVLESYQITLSHALVSRLLANNVALITCDAHHMPQGLLLNLNGNDTQQEHFLCQIRAGDGLKSRLWRQTIQAKIKNQATLLTQNGTEAANLFYWASKVKNGDPDNYEARAASFYWKALFRDHVDGFKRGQEEGEPNHLLNYGYAILRAVIARALVASGLLPTLGYHHRNRYNAYCLADDVMEPYRPYVDQIVLELVRTESDYVELTPTIKAKLLQIPVADVTINGQTSPLMLAVQQTTSSLAKCYAGTGKLLKLPKM